MYRISSHIPRSGGVMALDISASEPDTITQLGIWTPLTYINYTHKRIGELYKGISENIETYITFHNVGYTEKSSSPVYKGFPRLSF